ncbi:MAG TPA: DNA-formamidopyrimidine glycosylase family protein [Nitrososphaeraceae archaeon]|nr:DNA-formamidopyrimidine glycosylase family protein [Nitrososphaeraceae archaeon]
MSEGPEVKRTADKIAEAVLGKSIVDLQGKTIEHRLREKIVGSKVLSVDTYGKNIIIHFSGGIFLRNQMMWGKWRIYKRAEYDSGKAKPPPRIIWKRKLWKSKSDSGSIENTLVKSKTTESIQDDSRTRLILVTDTHVAVQYNGSILHFTEDNPLHHESITRLGPDALKSRFDMRKAKDRLIERENMKLADLLLDQTFVAGIGNKYKSEILFLQKLWPFNPASNLSLSKQQKLLKSIREVLKAGYLNAGRTRSQQRGEPSNKWDYRHWVFRRAGKPCWICGTKIVMDRQSSTRVTFWCSRCQRPLVSKTSSVRLVL